MREILFRGKHEDTNEWEYGSLHIQNGEVNENGNQELEYRILGLRGELDYVIPETVGQYTGLTDKNGKKIFEGDILKGLFQYCSPVNSVVCFRDGAFGLLWHRDKVEIFWAFTSIYNVVYEVIGNIHDNSELLGGGEE